MAFRFGDAGPRTRALDAPLAPLAEPAKAEFAASEAVDHLTGTPLRFDRHLVDGALRAREGNGCTRRRAADRFANPVDRDRCGDSRSSAKGSARVTVLDRLRPIQSGAQGVAEARQRLFRGGLQNSPSI